MEGERVIPSAGGVDGEPSSRRGRKKMHTPTWGLQAKNPIFSRRRLNIPCNVRDYLDVMIGPTTHAAWKAMDRIPRKHELALLCRNVAETSLLTGHAMRRVIRMKVTLKKNLEKIAGLKEEIKDKRDVLEARLPNLLEFLKKEAIREFMSSDEFKKMVGRLR
ncbi:hypothetical protein Dimus_010771 [Dionaea muscipula]